MAKLTTEQLIYLLYAKAYTETGTVTRSTVKSCLPREWKERAAKIYDALKTHRLVEPRTKDEKPTDKEGRFSLTEQGKKTLITDLAVTDYDFTTLRSYKVYNTVVTCLLIYVKEVTEAHSQIKPSEEMTFNEFQEKFRTLYSEERRHQELSGVVAIHKKELLEKFQNTNSATLSTETLNDYFGQLKSKGAVFISKGEKDELVHWVE